MGSGVRVRVPIGLEKALVRAAADARFRDALLRDRGAAVDSAGWELAASEAAVLASVPDATLAAMIARIDVRRHGKRRFMRGVVAAAFASAAAASALLVADGCGEPVATGIRPGDEVVTRPDVVETFEVEMEDFERSDGIRPDVPRGEFE